MRRASFLLTASVIAAAAAAAAMSERLRRAGAESVSAARVLVGASLAAADDTQTWPDRDFARLRIPPDATHIQLSVSVAPLSGRELFDAQLRAVDADVSLQALKIEPGGATGRVLVTVPAPADGDYVLRITRIDSNGADIAATRTLRIIRASAEAR